jgi:hypothetical protein
MGCSGEANGTRADDGDGLLRCGGHDFSPSRNTEQ